MNIIRRRSDGETRLHGKSGEKSNQINDACLMLIFQEAQNETKISDAIRKMFSRLKSYDLLMKDQIS